MKPWMHILRISYKHTQIKIVIMYQKTVLDVWFTNTDNHQSS